jgi:hypothetical protein
VSLGNIALEAFTPAKGHEVAVPLDCGGLATAFEPAANALAELDRRGIRRGFPLPYQGAPPATEREDMRTDPDVLPPWTTTLIGGFLEDDLLEQTLEQLSSAGADAIAAVIEMSRDPESAAALVAAGTPASPWLFSASTTTVSMAVGAWLARRPWRRRGEGYSASSRYGRSSMPLGISMVSESAGRGCLSLWAPGMTLSGASRMVRPCGWSAHWDRRAKRSCAGWSHSTQLLARSRRWELRSSAKESPSRLRQACSRAFISPSWRDRRSGALPLHGLASRRQARLRDPEYRFEKPNNAPEWTRTTTGKFPHKALNLARLPIPPRAQRGRV